MGKSLHYFRKNHLQKAWKIAGDQGGGLEDRMKVQPAKQKQQNRANKSNNAAVQGEQTNGGDQGPEVQFTRMHEKLKRRVTLNECVQKFIPEPFLSESPKHKEGNPYVLDPEVYEQALPIPSELTEQILKSKPNDSMQSLLKIPPKIFANFVKMTQLWMESHRNENFDKFMQPQNDLIFAKDLFRIWDENDTGKLNIEILTLPLISLGLINDTRFITKLLNSLQSGAKKSLKNQTVITIIDFAKIFKSNPFVEKVIDVIKNIVAQQEKSAKQTAK